MKNLNLIKRLWTDSHEKQKPQRFARYAAMLIMLLTLGVGQMWANGGIGYKGVKFTKNSTATGWYNIHDVGNWDYHHSSYDCRSGQSGVTDFNNANLGIVATLKLKAFVVIGWCSDGDYVAGQLKYRLYKQSASAPSYSTYNVGNYNSPSSGAANVLANSGNDRVVGSTSLTTNIVTASTSPGEYYLELQGLGRAQWANNGSGGSFNDNNGSEVKATLTVPGFTTTSTSNAYGSVNVGSNSSATISFTQHYGTALTTGNCALSGTNTSDFSVTGISETGVTVQFAPSATGSRSATLTITDANSKTCTITLSGTGTAASTATLTYHANYISGSGSGTGSVPSAQIVTLNSSATVANKNTLAFVNYTFQGWNTDEHITGTSYAVGSSITMNENKDLYAVWTRSIPLDDQGATTAVVGDVYGTYNSSYLPSFTNPKKTGYKFNGWTTELGGGGSFVIDTLGNLQAGKHHWTQESPKTNLFVRPSTSTSTLKAWWTQTVTLNANTANHGVSPNRSATATWNKNSVSLSTHCTPATGYRLDGYYTAATGGTKIINSDKSLVGGNVTVSGDTYLSSGKWMHNGATTLYAQYTLIPCSLMYGASTPLNSPTSVAMSYDDGLNAYYKDVTTNSSPYYFRFEYDGNKQYSGDWNSYPEVNEVTVGGSKVACATEVQGWDNKASLKYIGSSGTTIRIWFDQVNQKAWITETQYAVTVNDGDHGTVSPHGTVQAGATVGTSLEAVASTGYNFSSWSKGGTVANIGLSSTTTNPTTLTATGTGGTVTANYTAKQYTITLNGNGGAGNTESVKATYNSSSLSTGITNPTRTGYTFNGWHKDSGTGQLIINTAGALQASTSYTNGSSQWTNDGGVTLYAGWTAKTTNITLSQTGAGAAGSVTSKEGTYDADMPAITGANALPVAPQGYAFMGYFDDEDGDGTQYYEADGTSAHKWDKEDASYTLHPYFKKAEITNLVVEPSIVEPGEEVVVTPTISPIPEGNVQICWEVQYNNNGNPYPTQPTFIQGPDNSIRFAVPDVSATYRIQAQLKATHDCGGTLLNTNHTTFQVAGTHDVTIRYQDGSGRTIKASETKEGVEPLNWSDGIAAPSITGYTFVRWDAGDGVTIKDGDSDPVTTSTSTTINIKAVYDGTLTAVYNKKKMIYFNNTLGWTDVYVYFYGNGDYWDESTYGTGANTNQCFGSYCSSTPYYDGDHGHMTKIEGTNIWYFDYTAESIPDRLNIAFANVNQHSEAAKSDEVSWFRNAEVVRRGDFAPATLPMFVPLTTASKTFATPNSTYYNNGYWMNYPENTGYTLLIYNQTTKAGATKLYEIPFEFTADCTMPMELDVDLEAGQTYGFEIKRADNTYYSAVSTMTSNTTGWNMLKNQSEYCGLQTTAAGNYIFNFYYSSENYKMDVTYPVAVNDYRIVYTDLATWSKAAHTAGWSHPSGVITKNSSATEAKKDTVSFFWAHGSSPAIKYQQCTATGVGSVTWNAGTAISVSSYSSVLTKAGVYNFIFEQPAGGASISLVKVEPYTGNYYIRTDCAGSTKWSNFRALDHQLTYSEYAEEKSGYSHYYAHYVGQNTNVKFTIANDYSMCISDTLAEDYGTTIANIIAEGNANAGKLQSASANIRFMWNHNTNKISRAYIGGSANIADRFLVLEGDARMYDEDGNSLTGDHRDHNKEGNVFLDQDHHVVLHDDENFVYERTIKVNATAMAKLTAKYNENVQYFKGGSGSSKADSVLLLGGTYNADKKYKMRIVYDFKTNRLVTAYEPEGEVDASLEIDADIMLIREHQEAGEQLTFSNDAVLSKVHTVYGVMRFNRWTLNNKDKSTHNPVGDPKSRYERGLYWISFPFDVNLSDVFGFGTYGVDWIIEYYDGEGRAASGYWIDSPSFWRYVMPSDRADFVLKAGKGYVLALELDNMKDNNSSFWSNNIEQVELFFPSAEFVSNIKETNVTTTAHTHACSIDRTNGGAYDINQNRTIADSHWNMIGVPSYANYGEELTSDGSTTIEWATPTNSDLPYLYEWNMVDNTYTPQTGTTYPFKSMHSYMVQYHGEMHWALASATPSSVAARRNAEGVQDVEFRMEIQQNEKMIDQTFVRMSNDAEVSAAFKFDEDLFKEFNKNKANIYTYIENYIPAAGNILPTSGQTTLVPVGVKVPANGEYTFAIPDGTQGVGVTLIDNETGARTSLSALEYSIYLTAGDHNERFMLEISPISSMPTDIELINGEDGDASLNGVRKVIIDGVMYIIREGKMYDARGTMVK